MIRNIPITLYVVLYGSFVAANDRGKIQLKKNIKPKIFFSTEKADPNGIRTERSGFAVSIAVLSI